MSPAVQQLLWLFAAVTCGTGAAFFDSLGLGIMATVTFWVALMGIDNG